MSGIVTGPPTPMTEAISRVVVPLAFAVPTTALVVIAPLASTLNRSVPLVTLRLSTGMAGLPILPWTYNEPLATATVPVLRPAVVLMILLVQIAVPPNTFRVPFAYEPNAVEVTLANEMLLLTNNVPVPASVIVPLAPFVKLSKAELPPH